MTAPRTGPRRRRPIAPLLAAALAATGCADDGGAIVIATPWDRASCLAFEDAIRSQGDPFPSPIRWLRAGPGADPSRIASAGIGVDLLLGWPPETLASLDARGLLAPPDGGEAAWISLPDRAEAVPGPGPDPGDGPTATTPGPIADPRVDPIARCDVLAALDRGDWADGYALLLVRAASPPGLDAARSDGPEAAARVAGSDHPGAARVLDFAAGRGGQAAAVAIPTATPTPPGGDGRGGEAIVSAELVGATAIDAAEELRAAWSALEATPGDAEARAALVEPPPWPPASILALRDDPGRRALLDTLASAIARDESARSWLRSSWERPARPIDRATVRELATVAGGRLLAEPDVLPWLRAEWTAWARQRYGAIARTAAAAGPAPEGGASP